jgi:hypothetical protein
MKIIYLKISLLFILRIRGNINNAKLLISKVGSSYSPQWDLTGQELVQSVKFEVHMVVKITMLLPWVVMLCTVVQFVLNNPSKSEALCNS